MHISFTGYSVRKIEPAKNYDVESFARAMNPDFAPRLKKLFDPETEAAVQAQKTGIDFEPCLEKTVFLLMQASKAQINLPICTFWSALFLKCA